MSGLLDFVKTPEGQGLLSAAFGGLAGARRGQPINSIGRAGLAGLAGYSGAQDRIDRQEENAVQKQFREIQMQGLQSQMAKQKGEQEWRAGLPAVQAQAQTQYSAGDEGPTMTPGNPAALQNYMMDPRSPLADKLLEQQLLPKAEDYRVVGGDLLKIGSNGVTVAHQSQRPDNIPSEQKLYNLAVEQGYKGTFLNFLRDRVSNTEGAKAAFDVMPVTGPDGNTSLLPRSTVATQAGGGAVRPGGNFTGPGYAGGSAAGAATEQRTILEREREKAVAEGRAQDVSALDRELGRLPVGAPGMRVQSKAEEAAAIQAAKTKAEAEDPIAVAKREQKKAGTKAAAKNVLDAITDAKSMVGWSTAGMGSIGATSALRSGGQAKDLSTKLETIKANLGFDRLQEMRDQSPTGGALGAIAVQELTALQSTVASLDQAQSPEQLRKSLETIEGHYNRWMQTLGGGAEVDKPPENKPAQAFDSKPPAQQYKGKTMRGPDGKRYQSDGMIWKEVK